MNSEAEDAKQAVEAFTSVEIVIVQPIVTLSTMFLVYGMYIIIFGLSINILWRNRKSSASKAYTRWIIALFVLTTIYIATTVWINVDQTLLSFNAVKTDDYIPLYQSVINATSPSEYAARLGLSAFSSGIISYIFDYLMVHRCYVIWGHSKWILYPFAFIVIVTDMMGFVATAALTSAYEHHNRPLFDTCNSILKVLIIITTIYVSILTLLTAGRIWWTIRQVGQINESRVYTRYKIYVATFLESGLLFSVTQVVGVVFTSITDPEGRGLAPFDFNVISTQMAAIAPTLIVIRIAYGQTVESVRQTVSTLQFVEGGNISQQRSTVAHGTVDLRRSLAGVEERGVVGRFEMDKPPSNVTEDAV
ncbi:hypothetical protein PM082_004491 [Marasmius tenuissimus]|nr:hypothetical protein PM082_004491 [Marasmius tenuissimus]